MRKFYARVRRRDGGYIYCSASHYGWYTVVSFDANGNFIRFEAIQTWVWASTEWDNPVERGAWDIEVPSTPHSEGTAYFGETGTDEDDLYEYAPGIE